MQIFNPDHKLPESQFSDIGNTVALAMLEDASLRIMGSMVDFKDMLMRYTCAMKEIRTKFEVLNTEYNVKHRRNPILSIHTRLKQTASIAEKMKRLDYPVTVESIEEHLYDVAGVRVICSYLDDIYTVAESLLKQDDVVLLRKKDYIHSPKSSGYRSLHLIVTVPVFFSDVRRQMKVEVQLRTMGMEYWAELEHQLRYKQQLPEEKSIVSDLFACSEQLFEVDRKMLELRGRISNLKEKPTETELLLERLKKIDVPIV